VVDLIVEPFEEYRRQASWCLTSHALADFRRSPALFHKKHVLRAIPDEDKASYRIGRALHCVVLEPLEFAARYATHGYPVNEKTGEPFGAQTKAFTEWAEAQAPREVLTPAEWRVISGMAGGIRTPHAIELLSAGTAEVVVRHVAKEPREDVWPNTYELPLSVQGRFDWIDVSRRIVVDLKTCDELRHFEADARRFGYANQAAFYADLLPSFIGDGWKFFFIAIEKHEPYAWAVFEVSQALLAASMQENREAMQRLSDCIATGSWPTCWEDPRTMDVRQEFESSWKKPGRPRGKKEKKPVAFCRGEIEVFGNLIRAESADMLLSSKLPEWQEAGPVRATGTPRKPYVRRFRNGRVALAAAQALEKEVCK
jgi:exodeoxyribonuclease VIII